MDGKKRLSLNAVGWIYAYLHFSVEVACFFFLFSRFAESPAWWGIALLFDALAFLTQPFFGALADRFPRARFGAVGAVLLLLSLVLPWKYPAFVLLTLGNALVHVDGAEATLRGAEGKLTPSALFVGGGSFGVILGQLLGKNAGTLAGLLPISFMVLSLVLLLWIPARLEREAGADGFEKSAPSGLPTGTLILLAFFVTACRSYIGYAVPMSWNNTVTLNITLFSVMGFGKMLGGVFADCFGTKKVGVLSLLASVPFLVFGDRAALVSLIGVTLFSMTMPITLALIVSRLSDVPGFAFGITTVALFCGVAPAFFFVPQGVLAQGVTVTVLALLAAGALAVCFRRKEE